jgi:hypothetical protein
MKTIGNNIRPFLNAMGRPMPLKTQGVFRVTKGAQVVAQVSFVEI